MSQSFQEKETKPPLSCGIDKERRCFKGESSKEEGFKGEASGVKHGDKPGVGTLKAVRFCKHQRSEKYEIEKTKKNYVIK